MVQEGPPRIKNQVLLQVSKYYTLYIVFTLYGEGDGEGWSRAVDGERTDS